VLAYASAWVFAAARRGTLRADLAALPGRYPVLSGLQAAGRTLGQAGPDLLRVLHDPIVSPHAASSRGRGGPGDRDLSPPRRR